MKPVCVCVCALACTCVCACVCVCVCMCVCVWTCGLLTRTHAAHTVLTADRPIALGQSWSACRQILVECNGNGMQHAACAAVNGHPVRCRNQQPGFQAILSLDSKPSSVICNMILVNLSIGYSLWITRLSLIYIPMWC